MKPHLVAITAAALLAACAARAEKPSNVDCLRVTLTGLDLDGDRDARAVLWRIAVAAGRLCAQVDSPLWPGAGGRTLRCRREAIEQAVQRLGAPRVAAALAQFHAARIRP